MPAPVTDEAAVKAADTGRAPVTAMVTAPVRAAALEHPVTATDRVADIAAGTARAMEPRGAATVRAAATAGGLGSRAPGTGRAMARVMAATVLAMARVAAATVLAMARVAAATAPATARAARRGAVATPMEASGPRHSHVRVASPVTAAPHTVTASRGRRDRASADRGATTSCGRATGVRPEATGTLATRASEATRSSVGRASCSPFVRATMTRSSRTMCRLATSRTKHVSS
jgi:hypothetical protein